MMSSQASNTNNEGGELNWSLAPWATFKINATFALPNNKIHAGDTTTVSVPSQLIINSTDYELKGIDKDGNEQIAAYAHVDQMLRVISSSMFGWITCSFQMQRKFQSV